MYKALNKQYQKVIEITLKIIFPILSSTIEEDNHIEINCGHDDELLCSVTNKCRGQVESSLKNRSIWQIKILFHVFQVALHIS